MAALSVVGNGHAWAQTTGGQRLTVLFTSVDGVDQPLRVVASGPISGVGIAMEEASDDGGTFIATFASGTVSGTFEEADFALNFDPRSCTARPKATGRITVTGGTGAYDGANGELNFLRRGTIVGLRDDTGACLGPESDQPPQLVVGVIHARGTVTVP